MAAHITPSGAQLYLVPAPTRNVLGAQAAPVAGPAPAPNPNPNPNPANGPNANAQGAANQNAIPDENTRPTPTTPPRRNDRNLAVLRARVRAVHPDIDNVPKVRKVLGALNGQVVPDLRDRTMDEIDGTGTTRRDYQDLTGRTLWETLEAQDPYDFVPDWRDYDEL
ncbi:hypothetical protein BV20DRAFT_576249 [Pilatotrama ljubarskyi]|nr:hypothetical protein BV20DRAFT_576249 [Pilatotrama ljubarskyi]